MRARRRASRIVAATAFSLASAVAAQSSGGDFAITREVIASGGGMAAGGAFGVVTTTAQPVAGTAIDSDFVLRSGFQVADRDNSQVSSTVFRNGFEN